MKILITGGCGFIGGHMINFLLSKTKNIIFNIDKINYCSSNDSINNTLRQINHNEKNRYSCKVIDLLNKKDLMKTIEEIEPNIIINFAAETHVDRSIECPRLFLENNTIGTFNLLECSYVYWKKLDNREQKKFRLHHISTDEVYGSLSLNGSFNEESPYSPSSPYSASKAAADHFVKAWWNTYKLPIVLTNTSNNYGPWQYPEKLIPLTVYNALKNKKIGIYGDGKNIREWLFVEDHVEALWLVATKGKSGETYCIGSKIEKTNNEIVQNICSNLDILKPKQNSYSDQIEYIQDRDGHDFRYSINSNKLRTELSWRPRYSFDMSMKKTIEWYVKNINWCEKILDNKIN